MPRFLAILIVYLIVLGALSTLLYLIVSTAIVQVISLSDYVRFLLTPGKSGKLTPLEQIVRSFGISQSQIASARDQVVASIEGFAESFVPLLTDLVGGVLVLSWWPCSVSTFSQMAHGCPIGYVGTCHSSSKDA